MADERVCLGVITSAHGVRGMVKIKPFTETPGDVAAYGPVTLDSGKQLTITVKSLNKGMVLAAIDGVDSREAADDLRGAAFHVERSALPEPDEDSIYQADLIGRRVEDPSLGPIGEVIGVHDFGAGSMLEVKRPDASPVLIPFGGDNRMELLDGLIRLSVNPVWLEE
ncbi:MAG: 16S rRNA processing protein RimM [SAR116 cluster bacterium MED-G04]|jgi:16S rRNA processing protein RimM|nr:16S rRNA processing protein RimM [SAR116 cluster bacterium]OUW37648.1 MAG: 16S rRNA processing protein RimM [Gammaproteobacteria bacterium TMED183]PDH62785.1 MAG: 16S rRNA processing protein RimM [SAR116 cluster bacterium MED-G04]CAI8449447.1 MAG: Ribosome maturation factor RimM [SAR116 cluster bacterium MED-G04]|tara:strand:+ start:198 stop:698 length:501 start_codon:yes stop_codon:yes gene_type:complete